MYRRKSNQAFRFKRKDYYAVMAALPQKDTQDVPLFTLMRFAGERNTGAPFLFPTKSAADAFASRWAGAYTCVGVDRIFWSCFQNMAPKGKAILVLDVINRLGKLVDVGEISALWYS